jgi:hypothetical protein
MKVRGSAAAARLVKCTGCSKVAKGCGPGCRFAVNRGSMGPKESRDGHGISHPKPAELTWSRTHAIRCGVPRSRTACPSKGTNASRYTRRLIRSAHDSATPVMTLPPYPDLRERSHAGLRRSPGWPHPGHASSNQCRARADAIAIPFPSATARKRHGRRTVVFGRPPSNTNCPPKLREPVQMLSLPQILRRPSIQRKGRANARPSDSPARMF